MPCSYFYFQDSREDKPDICNKPLVQLRSVFFPISLLEKNITKSSTAYRHSSMLHASKLKKKKAQTNFVQEEVPNYFKSLSSFYNKLTLALLTYHFRGYQMKNYLEKELNFPMKSKQLHKLIVSSLLEATLKQMIYH